MQSSQVMPTEGFHFNSFLLLSFFRKRHSREENSFLKYQKFIKDDRFFFLSRIQM